MDQQPGAIVEEREEERALRLPVGDFERRPIHAIRHPEQIRERQLERLRRPAHEPRTDAQTLPIETGLGEPPLNRALAEGAQLQDTQPDELVDQRPDGELRVLATQFQERLHRRRIQRLVQPAIATRPPLQGGKLAALVLVIPVLDGGGGKTPSVPRLLGSLVGRLHQGSSILYGLLDDLHGGEPCQSTAVPGVFIRWR